MFLRQHYSEVERALKNHQYPNFFSLLQDIEQLRQIYLDQGPPGPTRKEIMLEFLLKAITEASEFFMTNQYNEMNIQMKLAEEQTKKLQQELTDMKSEQKEKLDSIEHKLRKSEVEKAELAAKEQSVREAYQQAQNDKTQIENEMAQKLQT